METRYIAIEGPLGVGKTSLAEKLGKKFKSKVVLEKYEENPFLIDFYRDMSRYAFQTQLYFLLSRYNQQQMLAQQELFLTGVISDYIIDKDRIFAYLNLNESELVIYNKLYDVLIKNILKPDLVVLLQAGTDVLMERIAKRGRSYEMNISRHYVENLNKSYVQYFFQYKASPMLVVNTANIDFVNSNEDFEDLCGAITEMKTGVKYYTPAHTRLKK